MGACASECLLNSMSTSIENPKAHAVQLEEFLKRGCLVKLAVNSRKEEMNGARALRLTELTPLSACSFFGPISQFCTNTEHIQKLQMRSALWTRTKSLVSNVSTLQNSEAPG